MKDTHTISGQQVVSTGSTTLATTTSDMLAICIYEVGAALARIATGHKIRAAEAGRLRRELYRAAERAQVTT